MQYRMGLINIQDLNLPGKDELCNSFRKLVDATPLLAALLAPVSTLYDVPALTQRWYAKNGDPISDPTASLILSAISLSASILANTSLVVRYTVHAQRFWHSAIIISTYGWIFKVLVGVSNLVAFGALRRNGPEYTYVEGFWCAIMSLSLSVFVAFQLFFHLAFGPGGGCSNTIHWQARTLIISEIAIVGLLAIQALLFSKIEGWLYLDGLYFSVVSLLTIGFGDYVPTHTSTKIMLFPFCIAGIVVFSNQISLIATFSARAFQVHNGRENLQYHHDSCQAIAGADTCAEQRYAKLMEEVQRLRSRQTKLQNNQERKMIFRSLFLLIAFWLVSGVLYSKMEGWSFGDALYFSYVFFLTLGYGDFSPTTPAGKTFFILWALIAVPIMIDFVVHAIQLTVARFTRFLTDQMQENQQEWRETVTKYFVPLQTLTENVKADLLVDPDADLDRTQYLVETNANKTLSTCSVQGCERNCTTSTSYEPSQNARFSSVNHTMLVALLKETALIQEQSHLLLLQQLRRGSPSWLLLQADLNMKNKSDIIPEFKGIANQTFRQRAWSQEKELIAQVATFRSSQARLRALSEHVTHSIGRYPA